MAQAPTNEQTVFPEQGPLPQANGADFGAQIGAATEGLGNQVSQTGDEEFQQVMKWQNLKNEATAQDLDVQFQGDLGKLEAGYYQLKGKAAADAQPQFQSDVESLRKKYLGVAPNPMVQNMLGQSVNGSIGYTLRRTGMYAGDQTKAWMIESASSRNEMLVGQGAQNYGDDGYQKDVGTALDAGAKNWAELNGVSDDGEKLYRAKLEDALQKGRIANAKTFVASHSIGDQAAALLGVQPGTSSDVGGANYHRFVLATEYGGGQDDPNNPDHQGPVQASQAWWDRFGAGGDKHNVQDSLAALDRETAYNMPRMEAALGRKPTDSELYLAHQQNLPEALALIQHPDDPAVNVLTPYYQDPKDAEAAVAGNVHDASIDPTKITAGQFAGLYNAGEATGAITPANGTGVDKQLAAAVAVLPAAGRMAMTKQVLDNWRIQSNAAYEAQQHQQVAAAQAQKKQLDGADASIQQMMLAHAQDPTKPAVNVLTVAQSPLYQGQPERVKGLIAFQKALDHPPEDTGVDKATTQQLYRGILDGSVKAEDVQAAFAPSDGSPGKISKGNLEFLQGVLKNGGDSADAKNTNALKTKFLSDNEHVIGSPGDAMDADSKYRFDFDFQQAWDAKIAKGENPKDLITPGTKDYFGNLSNLALYSHTAADRLAEQKAAQDEIDHPGLWARTKSAVEGAVTAVGDAFKPTQQSVSTVPADMPPGTTYAGTSKTDGAPLYRYPKSAGGGLHRIGAPPAPTPPPAAAPAVASGLTVPSGE